MVQSNISIVQTFLHSIVHVHVTTEDMKIYPQGTVGLSGGAGLGPLQSRAGPLQATSTVSMMVGKRREGNDLRTTGRGLSSPPRWRLTVICCDNEAMFAKVS